MCIDTTYHEVSMGMLGQNITSDSNRVWITKTHYPKGFGSEKAFSARKIIIISRNPIDVIPSFACHTNLRSHSLVPQE